MNKLKNSAPLYQHLTNANRTSRQERDKESKTTFVHIYRLPYQNSMGKQTKTIVDKHKNVKATPNNMPMRSLNHNRAEIKLKWKKKVFFTKINPK